jgi:hypothetical protein
MTNPSVGTVNLPALIVKNMATRRNASYSGRDFTGKAREASGDHV